MSRATAPRRSIGDMGEPTATHVTEESSYFTAEERVMLARWRAIVADMPPMTQEEIERVAEVFRRIDAHRDGTVER